MSNLMSVFIVLSISLPVFCDIVSSLASIKPMESNYTSIQNGTLKISSSPNNTVKGPSAEPYTKAQIQSVYYVVYIIYPILLFCCTCGNVINLVVLCREKAKGSTNAYMTTVAISDLFVLWLYLPYYLYNISADLRQRPSFITSFKQYDGLRRWGQETFIQLSDWTLIIFSLVRLLAIVKPFSYRYLRTAKSARIATLILLGLGGLFTLNNVIDTYYRYVHHIVAANASAAPFWLTNWDEVQRNAEVAMTISKFFVLLVLNLTVIIAIRRHRKASIGDAAASAEPNSQRRYRNSNLILLGSLALYLSCQLPSLIFNCLTMAADSYQTYSFPKSVRLVASSFITMAFLANYSLNFFLYVAVSKRFRAQFAQIFGSVLPTWLVSPSGQAREGRSHSNASTESQEIVLAAITGNGDGSDAGVGSVRSQTQLQ